MLKKLLSFSSKKIERIPFKCNVCVLPLILYDDKTETFDYGQCFNVEIVNLAIGSMTIRHNDRLKKGDMLEFRTKHALEDHQCIKCMNFKLLSDDLPLSSFIGKVIWKNSKEAGINIIMMKEQDKATLKKLISE